MADSESPLRRRSEVWPKDTSTTVLVGNPKYANAIRQSLQFATPTLREVADELKVNYRTLQSYAAMERVAPPAFGEQLVKYLCYRIHNLTVLADFLADLLKAEAKREREVREVQEKREREIEKRWGKTP
jgi:hypothetical protein